MKNNEDFQISNEIVSLMKNDNNQLVDIDNEDIQHMVSKLVTDYLCTIGRGLARSKNKIEYSITKNNSLNREILPGLFFRIPITLNNREIFKQLLVKDLQQYTAIAKSIGQYSVLENTQEGIVLKNIQKIEKKETTEYNKATVFEPE